MLNLGRRRLWLMTLVALSIVSIICQWSYFKIYTLSILASSGNSANSTLGFGALLVVSSEKSLRRQGLLQAANVTGIELTIPSQPNWPDEDMASFGVIKPSELESGLVSAWMGHLHALKVFLNSSHHTSLILEDDVDWDIHLRTLQVPLAAASIRSFLNRSPDPDHYYGDPASWDLLYIGHCGDYFNPVEDGIGVGHHSPKDLTDLPHILYTDPSLPDRFNLHPYTASFLTALGIPEKTRVIHLSRFPLCTFAYAVTKASAARLVNELATPRAAQQSGTLAFDVMVMHACRRKYLRCWTLSPELFHHMDGQSLIQNNGQSMAPVDVSGREQIMRRNETSNIKCGFYSSHFYFGDDFEKLDLLKKEVGEKGRCLKPGRPD